MAITITPEDRLAMRRKRRSVCARSEREWRGTCSLRSQMLQSFRIEGNIPLTASLSTPSSGISADEDYHQWSTECRPSC